jgi:hypothetical protein
MSSAIDRRLRRWAVGLALAWTAIVGAIWWKREKDDRAAWQAIAQRASAIAAPFVATDRPHAPLLGEARPGEANAHYLLAGELFAAVPRSNGEPEWREVSTMAELPANLAARLQAMRPALEHLAAGAASERIDARVILDELASRATIGKLAWPATINKVAFAGAPIVSSQLSAAACAAVRADLAAGRPDDAVRRTADLLTLARDQFDLCVGISDCLATVHSVQVGSLWTDERLRELPAAAQRELATALQRFDEALSPATHEEIGHCRSLAQSLADAAWHLPIPASEVAAWLDAIAALPADDAPWSVRRPALEAVDVATQRAFAHSRTTSITQGWTVSETMRRLAFAQVRLLRMALAYHLGAPIAPLADPLGDGALLVTERGDELVLTSRGRFDKPIERVVRRP